VRVELRTDRPSRVDAGGDVLPGFPDRCRLLGMQRQAQPVDQVAGDTTRFAAPAEERKVQVPGVPVDEPEALAEPEHHRLGQFDADVAEQHAQCGRLAMLAVVGRRTFDDHVISPVVLTGQATSVRSASAGTSGPGATMYSSSAGPDRVRPYSAIHRPSEW